MQCKSYIIRITPFLEIEVMSVPHYEITSSKLNYFLILSIMCAEISSFVSFIHLVIIFQIPGADPGFLEGRGTNY